MTVSKLTRRQMFALCGGVSPLALSAAALDGKGRLAGSAAPARPGQVDKVVTANDIGNLLYPQNAAETAAGVIPIFSQFAWGDMRRYGADPTGREDASAAWADAIKCGHVELAADCIFKIASGAKHSGSVTVRGSGPTSVLCCDGAVLTLTEGSGSVFSNFGLEAIENAAGISAPR